MKRFIAFMGAVSPWMVIGELMAGRKDDITVTMVVKS